MILSDVSKSRSIIDADSVTTWDSWAGSHGALNIGRRDRVSNWRDDVLGVERDEEVSLVDVVAEACELERAFDRSCLRGLLPALQDLEETGRLFVGFSGNGRPEHRLEGREGDSVEGLVDVGAMGGDEDGNNPVGCKKLDKCRFSVNRAVVHDEECRLVGHFKHHPLMLNLGDEQS